MINAMREGDRSQIPEYFLADRLGGDGRGYGGCGGEWELTCAGARAG